MSAHTTQDAPCLPGCGRLAGEPNGKTKRRRRLLAMTALERKAHRRAWRALLPHRKVRSFIAKVKPSHVDATAKNAKQSKERGR